MSERLTVLNDDRLNAIRPIITSRLKEAADLVGGGAFEEFFDDTMRGLLRDGLKRIDAHEGTVWLLDPSRSFLMPRFNTGPNAAEFVGRFRQSLRYGMISMVVATEQPICENEVHKNQQQDKTLDLQLGVLTCAMIAVPFYFTDEMRGVISGVRLKNAGDAADPAGFSLEDLEALQLTSTVLTRLIEYRLLSLVLEERASDEDVDHPGGSARGDFARVGKGSESGGARFGNRGASSCARRFGIDG